MSRFKKLSQTIWYCQYHIVWVPKYRFRVLRDNVVREVEKCIRIFSEQQGCEVEEVKIRAQKAQIFDLNFSYPLKGEIPAIRTIAMIGLKITLFNTSPDQENWSVLHS